MLGLSCVHICLLLTLALCAFVVAPEVQTGGQKAPEAKTGRKVAEVVDFVGCSSLRKGSFRKLTKGITAADQKSDSEPKNYEKKDDVNREQSAEGQLGDSKQPLGRSETFGQSGRKAISRRTFSLGGIRWSKVKKSAADFFRPKLEEMNQALTRENVAEPLTEVEVKSLTDTFAENFANSGSMVVDKAETPSTNPLVVNLLHSANDLQEAMRQMVSASAEELVEKQQSWREKGRKAVESYCACKQCNLGDVQAKDIRSPWKYVEVLKTLAMLVVKQKSAHQLVLTMLPFMKAIFFPALKSRWSTPRRLLNVIKAFGGKKPKLYDIRSEDNANVNVVRKKRQLAGAALFFLIGGGLCMAGIIVAICIKVIKPDCGSD